MVTPTTYNDDREGSSTYCGGGYNRLPDLAIAIGGGGWGLLTEHTNNQEIKVGSVNPNGLESDYYPQ
uniref:Uncharacterized protein n=1 Tax=Oryza glumipatula TaxID=40148 RepID=A0A0D9YPP8_9ORYZ